VRFDATGGRDDDDAGAFAAGDFDIPGDHDDAGVGDFLAAAELLGDGGFDLVGDLRFGGFDLGFEDSAGGGDHAGGDAAVGFPFGVVGGAAVFGVCDDAGDFLS